MAAISYENEQMPWTKLSEASFAFAFLDSQLCKPIGKNAGVIIFYIMGSTLRCRRYIFLLCRLHLEAVHGFPGFGNVQLVVAIIAHFHALLCGFGKRKRFPKGEHFFFP